MKKVKVILLNGNFCPESANEFGDMLNEKYKDIEFIVFQGNTEKTMEVIDLI